MKEDLRLKNACVSIDGNLLDVMHALQNGALGIAVVKDSHNKVAGVLTDGDVRRVLINTKNLQEPILPYIQHQVVSVDSSVSRTEVLEIMQSRFLHQIPIIDESGYLVGIHLLHEVLGAYERPNWALIMAGGKGTRLGEITRKTPKPMLKVAGKPIIERIILHLTSYGIRKIYISVNYLYQVILDYLGDGSKYGCKITYLIEENELGTGGAISLLPRNMLDPFVVCNGDLITQANIHEMLEFHKQGNYGITLGLSDYTHSIPYGCVELNDKKVIALYEKPTINKHVNAGIYVVNPDVAKCVPNRFFPITDLIDECFSKNIDVGGWKILEDWLDVGQKNELKLAQKGFI
ncbi:MAG: sugar phosphate nucleotidyltransferase [bacterium]